MADFKNENDFKASLDALPEARRLEAARVLPIRAALRVQPLLWQELHESRGKAARTTADRLILPVTRASSLAVALSLVPATARELRPLAFAAARSAHTAARYAARYADAAAARYAARSAADAAAAAADARYVDAADADAADAAAAADAARYAARYADAAAALSADATRLDHGESPQAVLQSPLWPQGVPNWARAETEDYCTGLEALGDDWDVWTRWYRARLAGEPLDESLTLSIARISEDDWKKGPAHVNAMIRRMEEARAQEIAGGAPSIETHAQGAIPQSLPNLKAVIEVGLNQAGKLAAFPGEIAKARLPQRVTADDVAKRCKAVAVPANALLKKLHPGNPARYQVRPEYRENLLGLKRWLPKDATSGNIILADSFARNLRSLFGQDVGFVESPAFFTELRTILENMQALRAYFPEVGQYYDDIRNGIASEPFPLDAYHAFVQIVDEHTPEVFDPSVGEAAGVPANPVVALPSPPPADTPDTALLPPPDPLKEVPPEKAQAHEASGIANAIMKGLEGAEKAGKGVEGISKTIEGAGKVREAVAPYFKLIRDYIETWLGGGPGGGLPPPGTWT